MSTEFRFSIRELLMLTALVALTLALAVQHWRYRDSELRYRDEIAILNNRLQATQQALENLPVDDPEWAYTLATPSYAYARWAWRVYLPPGSRYSVHIDVGHVVKEGTAQVISTAQGRSQHMGVQGWGETVVIVERFFNMNQKLLGVSIGEHNTNCRLTPEVARCMANRTPCKEQQLGADGAVDLSGDETISLLMRWYPGANTLTDGAAAPGPAGFSVRLEPF